MHLPIHSPIESSGGESGISSSIPPDIPASASAELPLPSRSHQPSNGINPGSSLAALWIRISQDDTPPVSIPSTLMPLDKCPRCHHNLGPPLQATGRQVCIQCSWENKPRFTTAGHETDAMPDDDLRRLLDHAAAESLDTLNHHDPLS
jgi:hypothetical protein